MLKVRLLRDPRRRILTAQISCGIAAYLQIASVSASQEIVPITASRFLAQGTETQVDFALPALTERLIFLASAARSTRAHSSSDLNAAQRRRWQAGAVQRQG